ncbi:hypothetical protein G7Z17_g1777 [Cylindrodendrum hubeiense]|uniref:Uncharacterized protein n=1 Tax=Cylindrodendrum hubeiense TaxID=595255 RepID=A0A9P5HKX2_9HYPO|nr:hypothetical protein G7Z17_g1777 [Cylindrodendrum hubeiense]
MMMSLDMTTDSVWEIRMPLESERAANAVNYAQQCYSSNSSGIFDCTTFVTPVLPMTINYTADCPFRNDNGICKRDTSNLLIEATLDSNDHLGLNAPDDDRIQFRTTLHCAPLATEGYTSVFEDSNVAYTRYHYGPFNSGFSAPINFTYQAKSIQDQYAYDKGPQLVDKDPWYQATTPGISVQFTGTAGERKLVFKDEAASPLACVSQYQYCRGKHSQEAENSRCGPLAGYMDAILGAAPIFGLVEDLDVIWSSDVPKNMTKAASNFHWFLSVFSTMNTDPYSLIRMVGTSLLASQQKFQSGMQGPLPDDQWQIDIAHIWNTSLASIQAEFVNVARGTTRSDLQPYLMAPLNAHQKHMCENQVYISENDLKITLLMYLCVASSSASSSRLILETVC